jgi:serine/threonine protein kinase
VLELIQSAVEPPDELVRRLTRLQLCRTSDFRRARGCVRRLSRDLPAFDSVWIDALVQLRRLTPYQARLLERGDPEALMVNGCSVLDELGHGPHGQTLLARTIGRQDRVVLKRIQVPTEAVPECRQRLLQFIEETRGWSHPNLVVPHALFSDPQATPGTVCRWIPGLTLAELLVRRGRFPAVIVLEIARQLSLGLAALHSRGHVHGDLRLSNIRITSRGTAVLVDGGIRPAIFPELTIHEALALDAYDGVAPELIGTGIRANAGSEIYALGCLLWQLLTGRPPFSMADPLMKLAAHQTQRIADVRTLAPDVPAALAELIEAMTSPDINQRPRSFEDLLQRWGRPGLSSRSRLKQYLQKFDGAVPHFSRPDGPATERRWPWVAVLLFIAAGVGITYADRGLRTELLSIQRRLTEAMRSKETSSSSVVEPSRGNSVAVEAPRPAAAGGLLPLPAPVDGEILLTESGPYESAQVTFAGKLKIRASQGCHPIIQIQRESLLLAGESVTLENVTLVCESPAGQSPTSMILIKSNELIIHDCLFQRTIPLTSSTSGSAVPDSGDAVDTQLNPVSSSALVAWRPLGPASAELKSTRIEVRNTAFRTPGAALWLGELPDHVNLSNTLLVARDAGFVVSPKAHVHASQLEMEKVTLREGGPLLRLTGNFAEQVNAPTIQVTANHSVFAPGAGAGFIELKSSRLRSDAAQSVRMTGTGSLLAPQVNLMVVFDPGSQRFQNIADADEQFEGIVVSELQFGGAVTGPIANSRLETMTAPRLSSTIASLPGIDVARLPSHQPRRRIEAASLQNP